MTEKNNLLMTAVAEVQLVQSSDSWQVIDC